jgi:hypothetical protein
MLEEEKRQFIILQEYAVNRLDSMAHYARLLTALAFSK